MVKCAPGGAVRLARLIPRRYPVSEPLNVTSEHSAQAHRIIATGELDIATVPLLEEAFEAAIAADDGARILVDLAGLTFIDSTGLRLLVRMDETSGKGRLAIRSTPIVDRLLQVTGLLDQLPLVHEDEGDSTAK
jgi:anti-anti-sigma factor